MATKNPRVVGYVAPDDHAKLQQFMKEYDCTESKAIALILHSYFSNTPVSTPTSRVNEALSITPNGTLNSTPFLERLEALENKLKALSSTPGNTNSDDGILVKVNELENKVETLSDTLNSTLNDEVLQRLEALENKQEALSITPGEYYLKSVKEEIRFGLIPEFEEVLKVNLQPLEDRVGELERGALAPK